VARRSTALRPLCQTETAFSPELVEIGHPPGSDRRKEYAVMGERGCGPPVMSVCGPYRVGMLADHLQAARDVRWLFARARVPGRGAGNDSKGCPVIAFHYGRRFAQESVRAKSGRRECVRRRAGEWMESAKSRAQVPPAMSVRSVDQRIIWMRF